jgi:hypothetical protein
MRRASLPIAFVICVVPVAAHAGPFGQIGIGADVSSETAVLASPMLSAAAGYRGQAHTALLTVAFTPARIGDTDSYGTVFRPDESPIADASLHRFLVLVNLEGRYPLAEHRSLTFRFGIGEDFRRSSWVNPRNEARERSENGLALELGVAMWFERCRGAFGMELALSLMNHRQPPFGGTDLPGYTTSALALSFVGRLSAK